MLRVEVTNAHPRYRLPKQPIRQYIRRVLGTREATISVVFIDSRRCRALNREFLQHDYVTDVITFPLETRPRLEAEIYVNLDRARQQARELKLSFREEVARLVIHGTLHLMGYDDRAKHSAQRMFRAQERQIRHWFPNEHRDKPT